MKAFIFFYFLLRAYNVKNFFFFSYIQIYITVLSNFYLPGRKYRANLGCPRLFILS